MNRPTLRRGDPSPRLELWLMVGMLIAATLFRFHDPQAMPPGPSHDELRMMDLGELIVNGERPIHWTISYSAEPLFMYLLALAMPVWGFTPFGARLVTRFAGLLLISVVHRLARRLFGPTVALFASGLLAMTWWSTFFSRVALRGITLPLTFTGALICLWRGLDLSKHDTQTTVTPVRWGWLAGSGALTGLCWYTFTAARGLVILLPMLLIYLATLRMISLSQLWRVALVTLGVAAIVAAPFIYDMQVHPGAPESRLDQLSGVIDQFLAGNIHPLMKQALNTAGLFVLTGDPNWRYNVSGRPVFGPLLGALSLLGISLSIVRWQQPRYAVSIIWLLLGLAPSVLTPEAPSFVRGIGALPVIAVFPAIGAVTALNWIGSRAGSALRRVAAVLLVLLVLSNGLTTFRDLFTVWPLQPDVQEIYQASLTEAFRDINHSNLQGPVWISEPFPDDRHLLLAKRVLRHEAIEPRWFNAGRALILPPANGTRRYLLADFADPDEKLFDRWMSRATVMLDARSPESQSPAYRMYQVQGGPWVDATLSQITAQSSVSLDLEAVRRVTLPARFECTADLLGYELDSGRVAPGEEIHLVVYWRVHGPVFEPIASFVHLLDRENNVIGQYDGFDVPPWHWEPEAVVAQLYRFSLNRDAQQGTHWLEVGLYNAQTMERLKVTGAAKAPLGDRLVLGTVTLE